MTNKNQTIGHRLRHEVWNKYNNIGNINEMYLNFMKTPPRITFKNPLFENAKFSIAIENYSSENYLTEKVLDCFLSKTIPIYYGCPNIGEFFDIRGIKQFNTIDELNSILNDLDGSEYDKLADVVDHNYIEAQKYKNLYERVDNRIKEFIVNRYGY